jgi:hypothetical protein
MTPSLLSSAPGVRSLRGAVLSAIAEVAFPRANRPHPMVPARLLTGLRPGLRQRSFWFREGRRLERQGRGCGSALTCPLRQPRRPRSGARRQPGHDRGGPPSCGRSAPTRAGGRPGARLEPGPTPGAADGSDPVVISRRISARVQGAFAGYLDSLSTFRMSRRPPAPSPDRRPNRARGWRPPPRGCGGRMSR